ncbi:MAG: arsenate reductase (glutaredoxin) [Bacteroidota bacterium]
MKTIIYHNPSCSKSCETLSILEETYEEVTIIDYVNNPPGITELTQLIAQLGIAPEQLVRKNEPIYLEQFNDTHYTDDEWIVILSRHPILIERPIVVKDGKAIIGRPPKLVYTIL